MSDADREDLAARVAQLEQVVASQQQALRKLMPGRRDVLKGIGGAAAGGLGVYAVTGGVSAQSTDDESAGNIGTPDRSQDVWLDQVYDPGDNEFLNADAGEPINAQFGREWLFDSVDATNGYTIDGSAFAQSVAASGSVTLSSGTATVDTGISATGATFTLSLGVDDPDADVDLTGRLFWDDSAGTYKIEIVEATTSVGNPTANYDVVRVS